MVAEPVEITEAQSTTVAVSGGQLVNSVQVIVVLFDSGSDDRDDDRAFTSLASTAFAEDWESEEDAIFDTLLEDADLQ
jgi:hypothetical protein